MSPVNREMIIEFLYSNRFSLASTYTSTRYSEEIELPKCMGYFVSTKGASEVERVVDSQHDHCCRKNNPE